MPELVKLENELCALLASLKKSWLVCAVSLAVFVLTAWNVERVQLLRLVQLVAFPLAFVYWIVLIRTHEEIVRVMKVGGMSARHWNWCLWLATCWGVLVGTLLEVAIFFLYGSYAIRKLTRRNALRSLTMASTTGQG